MSDSCLTYVRHESCSVFICVTWLIEVSFICETWLTKGMRVSWRHWDRWYFKRSILGQNVTWLIQMWHMTHSSEIWLTKRMLRLMTWKRSIFGKNVTWHIHMRHMTDLSETWLTKRMYVGRHVEIGDAAALYVEQQCDMTHSYAAYDSFIWDMTHQENVRWQTRWDRWRCSALFWATMWHDTFICGIWLIHLRHDSPKECWNRWHGSALS